MRTLVTGGGGQLGRAFSSLYPQATVLTRAELDITDADQIAAALARHRPQVIVNAAAFTGVDEAEAQPAQAARVNVAGVMGLAQQARKIDALLVQISSDYVFAGSKPAGYTELDRTRPLSVYGRTKLQSEMAARAAGGRYLIIRTCWVFGEGKNFIRSIVGAARLQQQLQVVDDQRGCPTYARDLAPAIIALVDKGCTGVFNLAGGGTPASWAEVAEMAIGAAGLSTGVRRVTTAQYLAGKAGPVARRPANSELDCSKAAGAGVALRPWPQAVQDYAGRMAGALPL